ncbi:hypothetical protein CHU95_16230 [Niveispirillum lacus]|uniref:Uncharacterized protein n=1 Tax=Niveispirillum lacus TaxID=1981099 RepID=A0A255YT47_9PROT|nr:DUF692 domain-containing protein [Niveispirillum lacus]OYQ32351.1 hypothetical protein CHU95_16230 [Niveispirillum lacus]
MHTPAPRFPDLVKAGVGLRHAHVSEFLTGAGKAGWLEVHAENYLVAGGPRLAQLEKLRQDYPVSFHSVALSLGAADGVDTAHLARLRALYDRFQPCLVSDHLAWTGLAGTHVPDLLPLPLTGQTLEIVAANVARAQDALGRRLLVENPSLYVRFTADQMDEGEFLAALAVRTGCGLLLDLNNLYISASNRGQDAARLLTHFPGDAVQEIHLAGHARMDVDGGSLLIDDHGSAVPDPVWALYESALRRFGPRPTLVEWDTALPPLAVLLSQATKADAVREAAAC